MNELILMAETIGKKGDEYRAKAKDAEALIKAIACYECVAVIYKRIFELQNKN